MLCCYSQIETGHTTREGWYTFIVNFSIDNVYNLGAQPNLRTLEVLAHLQTQVLGLISFAFDSDCIFASASGRVKGSHLRSFYVVCIRLISRVATFGVANKFGIFALGTSVVLANLGIAKLWNKSESTFAVVYLVVIVSSHLTPQWLKRKPV